MAKTIRLAILLIAILCLVPGCGGESAGDGSCDPDTALSETSRCVGLSTIQTCEAQPDGSGAWEHYDECGDNYQCTMVVSICEGIILGFDCPDEVRHAECVSVEPLDATSCSDECGFEDGGLNCDCVSKVCGNFECTCDGCDSGL